MSSTSLQTAYNPAGAGANYANLTMGAEDELFFLGAKHTQWKQKWSKYTPHQAAVILQGLTNVGLGRNMVGQLIKTPDFLYSSYTVSRWPGIKPNVAAGVTRCSYVNARALYAVKSHSIKIGAQPIFTIDGPAQLVLMELMGLDKHYAEMIGLFRTEEALIHESRFDSVLYQPWIGFPFQDRPDLAFSIGAIAFHNVTSEIMTRPVSDLYVNYDGAIMTGKGLSALPLEIASGSPLSATSVDFTQATNCVWVSADERMSLIHGYNESIFRECLTVGQSTIAPSATAQRVVFDLNMKGPCAMMWVTIQSQDDLNNGNWTKLCSDNGEDYFSEGMLITGSTAREDGLPASFYRTAKIIEAFKTSVDRHIYLLSFETNALSKQMTGHQNMTNAEKTQWSALYNPHKSPLEVTVQAIVYNGWYTGKCLSYDSTVRFEPDDCFRILKIQSGCQKTELVGKVILDL